jgi:hypothetical protein
MLSGSKKNIRMDITKASTREALKKESSEEDMEEEE